MKIRKLVLLISAALLVGNAYAATDAEVDASFFPYKDGVPKFAGLSAGMTINKSNVSQFKDILDSATYGLVEKGELEIPVEDTQSAALHSNYVAATKKYNGQVKLGSKPGTLEGYVAGRPFPTEPDKSDPRAGEKLAFNYKYTQITGDSGRIYPFPWLYIDYATGKVERQIDFDFHFISLKHRTTQDPVADIQPNPAEIYRNIYLKVLGPQELKNTQLLINRFDDDTKIDESYLYLGFQRRVRRLATGQTTDSFLGSDLMIEDFECYNGRVLDQNWKYVETKDMLMPIYRHSEWKGLGPKDSDGYGMVKFGGKSQCFANIPWSLRKVYVLEATPTNTSSPIGKRLMYLDAQATVFPIQLIYDKKGSLWKRWMVGYSDSAYHAPVNKNAGIMIYTTASMTDIQSQHCTALALKMSSEPTHNPPSMFNVQFLRGGN
jgi:Protein of unknown function (DUF1329)